jgi:hypothetical protein
MESVDNVKHPFVIATVLDPSFKSLAFFPDRVREAAYNHVRSLVNLSSSAATTAEAEEQLDESISDAAEPPPAKRQKGTRFAAFSFLSQGVATSATPIDEFDKYLATTVPEQCEVLPWWKNNGSSFPRVANMAKKYLAIPATSAASERLFSATGRLINKFRSSLLPERVESLAFLNMNECQK